MDSQRKLTTPGATQLGDDVGAVVGVALAPRAITAAAASSTRRCVAMLMLSRPGCYLRGWGVRDNALRYGMCVQG